MSRFGELFRVGLALLIVGTPLACPSYTAAVEPATDECDSKETPVAPLPLDTPEHECGPGCLCHGALTHSSVWNTSMPDLAAPNHATVIRVLGLACQSDLASATADCWGMLGSPIHFPALAFGQPLCALTGCRLL